jgi:hypothetical protein
LSSEIASGGARIKRHGVGTEMLSAETDDYFQSQWGNSSVTHYRKRRCKYEACPELHRDKATPNEGT